MMEKPDKIIHQLENYVPDPYTLVYIQENYLKMKRSEMAKHLKLPKYLVNKIVEVVRE